MSSPQYPQLTVLSHPLSNDKTLNPPPHYRPEISIIVDETPHRALLDSGASVSAIAEDLYRKIKTDTPETPMFPLTSMLLTTALSNKTVKVNSQIYLPFHVGEFKSHAILLVVPRLSMPLILGTDWLLENKVKIDYETKEVYLATSQSKIPFKLVNGCDRNEVVSTVCKVPSQTIKSVSTLGISEIFFPEILTIESGRSVAFSDVPLNTVQQGVMETLFQRFKHVFQDRPGLHRFFSYRFNVRAHEPYKIKPYPVPFSRRPAVQREINRMLEWGVIERSDSAYNNPLVTVVKPDGSIRLCLDARKLNTIILPTRDTSPPIDEILAKFNKKSIFSSLDFVSGYWQIPLDHSVRPYTSFLYDGRSYHFCVVPFGLNVSNAAFGKGLEAAFNNIDTPCPLPNDIHTYVDDMLVSSCSFETHVITLAWVFEKISRAGLTLKLTKCHFNKQTIKFLGHFVSATGIVMDPDKILALKEFPEPRNKKDLQSFLGFCNFYRKFSQNHSSLLFPLSHLIKKETQWSFTEHERHAFNQIKTAFSQQVALTHPNFNEPFCIQTDASMAGLGAELFQVDEDHQRYTISFASRSLSGAERNYTVTELELLGILFACQKFRIYILGFPIFVYTDHKALTFLFTCRLRNARLTRWTLALQEFNLKIVHCPGRDNPVDTLSRYPLDHCDEPPEFSPAILHYAIPPPILPDIVSFFNNIQFEQDRDPRICGIRGKLQREVNQPWCEFYQLKEKVLFTRRSKLSTRWLLFIPKHLTLKTVLFFHEYYAHAGARKTAHTLNTVCFFPSFNKTIRHVVQGCVLCQKIKPRNTRIAGPMQSIISEHPLDRLLVDFYGPLPTGIFHLAYIFVAVDNFTRYVRLYPIRKANAGICIKKLTTDYFPNYGVPTCIVSDHGKQFVSKLWQQSFRKYNIHVTHTSVYHPQSNPAERVMRELGRMFRTYCHENHSTWPRYVPQVEWTLNNLRHESTHHTPSELFLRQPNHNPLNKLVQYPETPDESDYDKKLFIANEVQISKADARKKRHARNLNPTMFEIGDLVLVRVRKLSNLVEKKIAKFFLLYDGPFRVKGIKKQNAYELVNPVDNSPKGTHSVIHLKKYNEPVPVALTMSEAVDVSQNPRSHS